MIDRLDRLKGTSVAQPREWTNLDFRFGVERNPQRGLLCRSESVDDLQVLEDGVCFRNFFEAWFFAPFWCCIPCGSGYGASIVPMGGFGFLLGPLPGELLWR